MSSGALIDSYGRTAVDLRVSLTDKCNLRCTYCMPAEGLDWLPRAEVLTDAEVVRLVRIAVESLGVREVRFTGGEPLLRMGLVDIVAATASLRPRPSISLTTNGLGLTRLAGQLADAGLDRVNVSVDTLDPARFEALTRRDRLSDVLDGLTAAADAGLVPVKINSALMRGINDNESADLLRFALKNRYELRFIEQMPLDAGHIWDRHTMVTAERDPGPTVGRVHAGARPIAPRGGAGRDVAHRRISRRQGGHNRQRDATVLWRLRPDPVDRRRPGAQLPLRSRRVRPAGGTA